MPAQARKSTQGAKAASAPKPKQQDAPDPTHRVLRQVVIEGEQREPDELVHLDGLNATALESSGYVVRL